MTRRWMRRLQAAGQRTWSTATAGVTAWRWAPRLSRSPAGSDYAGLPFAVRPLPSPARRGVAARWRPLAVPVSTALLLALTALVVALTVEVRAGRLERATLRADLAATAARGAADEAALRAHLGELSQVSQQQQADLAALSAAYAARARQADELQRALASERAVAARALAATTAQATLAQADTDTWRQHAGAQQAEREALAGRLAEREADLAALTAALAALQRQAAETEALAARVRQTLGLPKPTGPAGGDAMFAADTDAPPAEQLAALDARWRTAHQDLLDANRALQARLTALRSLTTAGQPVRLPPAVLALAPAGWPATGPLSSPFGPRLSPIDEQMRFHPGVDIVVAVGTPVRATQAGTVTLAGPHAEYGLVVKLRHDGGFETLYGHNSHVQVRVGQVVARGQVIARSGNTGASTGPHVHYEISYQGRALDPGPLLIAGAP